MFTHPPAAVAVLLAVGIIGAYSSWHPDPLQLVLPNGVTTAAFLQAAAPWFFWVLAGLIVVLPAASLDFRCFWTAVTKTIAVEDAARSVAAEGLPKDFGSLCAWLRDDREIEEPSQDHFGHAAVAHRIADRLLNAIQAGGEDKPDMALVGNLGTGKSSILKLAKRRIEQHQGSPTLEVVEVSLWPYDTPEAAVRGVIDALVRTMGKYVGTTGLARLSSQYLDAVEKLGSWGAVLASLLRLHASPDDVLKSLDDAALVANVRIVLWVEDLERFAGSDSDSSPDSSLSAREADRLNPIRSLLYLLHRLDCVSVVVASTSMHARFDLEKIARYVESPPELERHHVWAVLSSFRKGCLDQQPFIDPFTERHRSEVWDLSGSDLAEVSMVERFAQSTGRDPPSIVDTRSALTQLCRTPRQLKQGLRSCLDVWEKLRGEVDFDDLLTISILRVAEPDAFALIHTYICGLRIRGSSGSRPVSLDAFEVKLRDLIGQEDSLQASAVRFAIGFIFPDRSGRIAQGSSLQRAAQWRPQGLGTINEVDYWRRYLAVENSPAGWRDQDFLRQIEDWKRKTKEGWSDSDAEVGGTNHQPDLLEDICDPERYEHIHPFSHLLGWSDLVRLLREWVARRREVPRSWRSDRRARGLDEIVSIMRNYPGEKRPQVASELVTFMQTLVPQDLALSYCLLHRCLGEDSHGIRLIDETGAWGVLDTFLRSVESCSSADLTASVDGLSLWWLRSLESDFREVLPAHGDDLYGRWTTLLSRFVEAAHRSPHIWIPQFSFLLVEFGEPRLEGPPERRHSVQKAVFQPDRAELVGRDRLRALFENSPTLMDDLNPRLHAEEPYLRPAYEEVRRGLAQAVADSASRH